MRIAVVYLPVKDREKMQALAVSMTRALEAKGHMVDIAEARADETPRLTGYEYVVIGTESASLFGKISNKIPQFLAQAGTLTGKRSMAFIRKSGLRPEKALARLMRAMEAEGMVVNCSEIIGNDEEAKQAAREAPVERY